MGWLPKWPGKSRFWGNPNTPPLRGIGESFKRAQNGDNCYGIASLSQHEDGHGAYGSPLAVSDAHIEVLLGSRSGAPDATGRRPYIGTCSAKQPITSGFG